jgi:hypothetical protein
LATRPSTLIDDPEAVGQRRRLPHFCIFRSIIYSLFRGLSFRSFVRLFFQHVSSDYYRLFWRFRSNTENRGDGILERASPEFRRLPRNRAPRGQAHALSQNVIFGKPSHLQMQHRAVRRRDDEAIHSVEMRPRISPAALVEMTGSPQAIASGTAMPNGSPSVGKTNASAAARSDGSVSDW